jgi:hypothetical protein
VRPSLLREHPPNAPPRSRRAFATRTLPWTVLLDRADGEGDSPEPARRASYGGVVEWPPQ